MSYASDYDDLEQSSQGEDCGISDMEEFAETYFGSSVGEMSNSERGHFMWQWRQRQREERSRRTEK